METRPQRCDADGQNFQLLPFVRKHRREQIWLGFELFAVIFVFNRLTGLAYGRESARILPHAAAAGGGSSIGGGGGCSRFGMGIGPGGSVIGGGNDGSGGGTGGVPGGGVGCGP